MVERLAPLVGRVDAPLICAAVGERVDRFVFVADGGVGEVRVAADLVTALRRAGDLVLVPYGALARSTRVLEQRPDVGAAVILGRALEQTRLGDLR